MPSVWDHRADKDLLLTIIESGSLNHIDWPATSYALRAKGYNFSHEACRQHYQKIRKEARTSGPSLPGSHSTAPTSTPTKARKTKSTPKTTSSHTNGFYASLSDAEGDDAEDLNPTPRKRARTVKREKREKREKAEENDYEDELGGMDLGDLGGYGGQTGVQFKIEEDGEADLEDEDIYI